eukprot:scaffold328_cov248-Pinguiococcus_pyrenoidosus.AAC.6
MIFPEFGLQSFLNFDIEHCVDREYFLCFEPRGKKRKSRLFLQHNPPIFSCCASPFATASIDAARERGMALEQALRSCKDGDVDRIRRLTSEIHPDSFQYPGGRSLLMVAAAQAQSAVLKALLEAGAEVDRCNPAGRTALHWAARSNHFHCVEALLKAGANVDCATKDGTSSDA